MKNLANLLRKADISPRERIVTLVKNDVYKEKNGKGILTDSEIYSLSKGWKPKNSYEVDEYNKYYEASRLEATMKLDAQMFAYRSENLLLRSHLLFSHIKYTATIVEQSLGIILDKHIQREEVMDFVVKNTYMDYKNLIHVVTFNNLPKDIRDDLLILDDCVAHDNKYLEDEVFIYEVFKNSKTISAENKEVLINHIYSCMYHDRFRKIKNGSEKDGFLPSCFFAELPAEEILQKWAEYAHVFFEENDTNHLLDKLEEYAKETNQTTEFIIKNTLSKWIDDGLFISEHIPLFFSSYHNTWNGNTKLTHKKIFTKWYEELQKTKNRIEKMLSDGELVIEQYNKYLLGSDEKIQILTGKSLYMCKRDIDFVKEYKEQLAIVLPLARAYLFIKKYNKPLDNHETLKSFYELSKIFSDLFDVDMTDIYSNFLNSFEREITLLNQSVAISLDYFNEFLYTKNNRKYTLAIKEDNFLFTIEGTADKVADIIIENYKQELRKMRFMV